MNKTEQSLFDCLAFCEVATLPEAWDKKSVWLTAICRTRKNDLCTYYAYCERGVDGKPKIMRDFGAVRAIVEIEEFYPLLYLDSSYVRKFPKNDEGTANLTEYLKKNGFLEAEHADNRKELDKMNIILAMQKQLADEKKKKEIIIKD